MNLGMNVYFIMDDVCLNSAGLSNLTSLSLKKCAAVTAEGAKAFADLVNLVNLDLERCPKIHGGLVHIKGSILFPVSIAYKTCPGDLIYSNS